MEATNLQQLKIDVHRTLLGKMDLKSSHPRTPGAPVWLFPR